MKDKSKLVKKKIRDKTGKMTSVWVLPSKDVKQTKWKESPADISAIEQSANKWVKGLSDDQKNALLSYKHEEYLDINDFLKGKLIKKEDGKLYRKKDLQYSAKINAQYKNDGHTDWIHTPPAINEKIVEKYIKDIDTALAKSTFPKDTTIYRGVRSGKKWISDLGVGDIIEDSSFVSTSLDKDQADLFARDAMTGKVGEGALFKIKAKKGQKGGYLDVSGIHDMHQGEQEFLLPRNTQLEIESIEKDGITPVVTLKII